MGVNLGADCVLFLEQKIESGDVQRHAGPRCTRPLLPRQSAGATPQDPNEPWRVPAQRRRVTEYLVLEKKEVGRVYPWQFPRADVVGGRLVLEWNVLGWVGLGAC